MNYPPTIQKLIDLFAKFPTVGPRTAARFVFYLLKTEKENIDNLVFSISNLKNKIKNCKSCFSLFESSSEGKLCEICSNPGRDKTILCIIEKETDLMAIERIKKYKGLYFVLGGLIPVMKRKNIKEIRKEELKQRIENHPEIKEVIIAIDSTVKGEATTLYLERLLKPLNLKITRLARGLPVGGELEYADEETLLNALEGRK